MFYIKKMFPNDDILNKHEIIAYDIKIDHAKKKYRPI